jgi:adenylate kinase family enzyme
VLLLSNQIIYPTFKDAQQLYSQYSTIENVSVLINNLKNNIDSSFLSTMSDRSIHEIYNKIILDYYPNEICIKSSFIKQILVRGKKHVTIFELPVGSSRTDLCKINGESITYEIKTDLDNFSRLQKQIKDYYKIFDKVFIICSEENVSKILALTPEKCGLYSYKQNRQKNYKFKLIREASINNEINSINQLNLLRKNELNSYFAINESLQNHSGILEYVVNAYSTDSINRIFKLILKHRFEKKWTFLQENYNDIFEIDYQWFYKNQIEPSKIYMH